MAKGIFSFRNNIKKPLFTETVKRIVLWDIVIFFLLFLISNTFTVAITYNILINNLDKRLKNEIETLLDSFVIERDSVKITGYNEIKEPDFTEVNPGSFLLQIYSTHGKLLLTSQNLQSFGTVPFNIPVFNSKYEFQNMKINDYHLRTVYTPLYNKDNKTIGYLQLSVFRREYNSIIKKIIIFNLLNLPFILLLIIVVSIFLAKKSYAPLNKIIDIAEKISASNLQSRIKYNAHPKDELGRLRDTLNNLFTRLEVQINQISQFTDNASHQLMSPLTAIKTELEYIQKKERKTEEYKETLTMLNAQTDKMINIIKTLLIISKFSSSTEMNKSIFNVSKIINDSIKPVFAESNINYKIPGNLYLRGSYEGFQIAVENLVENAVKYSPVKSPVVVEARQFGDRVIIKVEDTGIGINDEEKEKIFDRFYRSTSAMKDKVLGYGLGLSLVKTIVLSMEGSIKVEDNSPSGTRFIISFPSVNVE